MSLPKKTFVLTPEIVQAELTAARMLGQLVMDWKTGHEKLLQAQGRLLGWFPANKQRFTRSQGSHLLDFIPHNYDNDRKALFLGVWHIRADTALQLQTWGLIALSKGRRIWLTPLGHTRLRALVLKRRAEKKQDHERERLRKKEIAHYKRTHGIRRR